MSRYSSPKFQLPGFPVGSGGLPKRPRILPVPVGPWSLGLSPSLSLSLPLSFSRPLSLPLGLARCFALWRRTWHFQSRRGPPGASSLIGGPLLQLPASSNKPFSLSFQIKQNPAESARCLIMSSVSEFRTFPLLSLPSFCRVCFPFCSHKLSLLI